MSDNKPVARIRTEPEDFQVDELPAYEPGGAGEHLYVTFRKRGLDTLEAVRRIASALGVSSRDAGTAGLKDRHAVTTQTASFPFPLARELPAIASLGGEGLEVLSAKRHNNKLRTGHLRGNRFRLVLRGLPSEQVEPLCEALRHLGETGLPNRYGVQRFGRGGDNAEQAVSWMSGRSKPPRDQRVRRLQFSALQSMLFNKLLDARVQDGTWDKALVGDLVMRADSGRTSLCTDPSAIEEAVRRGELSASGPMFGARMTWPEGAPGELERRILQEGVEDPALFDKHRNLGEGARRALRLVPAQLTAAPLRDLPGSLLVEFVLPKGAYATSVLEAVCVVEDATRAAATAARAESVNEVDAADTETLGKEESL